MKRKIAGLALLALTILCVVWTGIFVLATAEKLADESLEISKKNTLPSPVFEGNLLNT